MIILVKLSFVVIVLLEKSWDLVSLLFRLGGVNGVLQPRVHQEGDHRPPEGPDPVDQDVLGHGVTLAPGKQDGG